MTDQELIEADSADGWKAKYEHLEAVNKELIEACDIMLESAYAVGVPHPGERECLKAAMNRTAAVLDRVKNKKDGAK